MSSQLILPAAGEGLRLGSHGPKALIPLVGVPLLIRTLNAFAELDLIAPTIVVAPEGYLKEFDEVLGQSVARDSYLLVAGGSERQHSVRKGLEMLSPSTEFVIIHDAARPFVSTEMISQSIDAARSVGASTVAIPCVDTILEADEKRLLLSTPDRTRLWSCQTPQTFRVEIIRDAHKQAEREGVLLTDDATLVRRAGGAVQLVPSSTRNIKITTPDDLLFAEYLIRNESID